MARAALALVLASATAALGQAPAITLHVRGSVLDANTRQPIPNARVQVIDGPSVLTSANGNYDIVVTERGSHNLKVEAEGYRPALEAYSTRLDGRNDSVTVDMRMYRPGIITGRMIDAETKQPVVGMLVRPLRVSFRLGRSVAEYDARPVLMNGQLLVPELGDRRTGKQGFFRIEQLRPGTYSLGFPAELSERVLNSGTPPAREPAKGYRRQRWPSTGIQAGVELRAGSLLELGDISLTREPLFRITGVLTGCPNGDDISRALRVTDSNGANQQTGSLAPVACGESFTVENLSPGEYLFDLNVEGVGEIRVGQVTLVNRDVEFSPVMSMPLVIVGSILLPENFPAFAQLGLLPIPSGAAPRPFAPVSVGQDGSFKLSQVPGDPVEIRVQSLPAPYYVSEMLFNGAPLRDGILEANPYTVVRELKIRIAADGAALTGTVRKNTDLASNSSVILVAWPERLKNGFPVHYVANALYGQFTFSAVPPGSYRAVAVEREAWESELQKPGVLSGLASTGAQVDLAPNGAQELTLEVRWIPLSQ